MKNNIKNILIPIDLTDTSLNALNTAIQMAKRHSAFLHLLYVRDIMDYYPKMGQMATLGPMLEDIWGKDKSLLEKIVLSIMHSHQVNCSLHASTGYQSTVIAETAATLHIDMIVLGTDPDIGNQSYLNDSLAYKILQNTTSHLLTVPAGKEVNNFKRIIFPVMIQETPVNKLRMSQCVIEKNNAAVSIIGLVKKQDLNLLNTIRKLCDRIKGSLKMFAGSVTRMSVYSINSAKDLAMVSKDERAQLIVIQGNTKRNLKEFFFGNFTQRMIRNVEVAVLFIKDVPMNAKVL